ncbi:MAG: MFS transporter [Clostridia bacterium]|nr:MFS transporter [Clostridia bacterium]
MVDSSDRKSTVTGRRIIILCFFAYAVSYLGRNTFAACITDMTAAGLFPTGFDGYVSAAFLVFYGAGQFINGRLTSLVRPGLFASAGLLGSGVANILMAFAGNRFLFVALWAVNGFCCSMLWPTVIRVFSEWLDTAERNRASTNISPSIPAGSILCYLICYFMLKLDWRAVFILSGSLLCAGSAVWFTATTLLRKDVAARSLRIADEELPDAGSTKKKLTPAYFFAAGLGIMAVASIVSGTLKEAVISWIPTYLTENFGFLSSDSALISVLMPLISVAGPYFAVYIDRKFFRNECATVGMLFALSAFFHLLIVLFFRDLAVPAVILLSLSSACLWGVNTMLMTYTCYHFRRSGLSAAVSGTLNAAVYLGSSSFTYIYRGINEASGSWDPVVAVWAVMGTAGCLFCFLGAKSWKKRRPE